MGVGRAFDPPARRGGRKSEVNVREVARYSTPTRSADRYPYPTWRIFVSMELSRSKWLITSLSPGGGEKMSKHAVAAGDSAGMLAQFAELSKKAEARTGRCFPIIVIQEAGLDGFWIHRVLQAGGIESHVVDPASIATSQRRRRAKTDKIDGEALVRALLAFKRGEPRVCAMVRVPMPEEKDRRRISRERKVLTNERVSHVRCREVWSGSQDSYCGNAEDRGIFPPD